MHPAGEEILQGDWICPEEVQAGALQQWWDTSGCVLQLSFVTSSEPAGCAEQQDGRFTVIGQGGIALN